MVEKISEQKFFHVLHNHPHSTFETLADGTEFTVGNSTNPFFGFYENIREYDANTLDGLKKIPAIQYIKGVRDENLNVPNFPAIACEVAVHYMMLARELIMEDIRQQIAPDAPSRKTSLWIVDNLEGAKFWLKHLGGEGTIVQLLATGTIHSADASYLLGDSEPLTQTYNKARSYWLGKTSDNAQPEILFSGKATVVKILD